MSRRDFLKAAAGALASAAASGGNAQEMVVRPRESDALLANPGMGWQTFHRFADEDKNLAGLPSSSAYFRFYWKEVEPREGEIRFDLLDRLFARARQAGQRLAFRIMCAGTAKDPLYVPQWLKEKGCRGFEYRYGDSPVTYWVPDMEDPLFQEAHFRLIAALGQRYDGHPDMDLLDIGSVGLWGEWHMSGTGVKMPPWEVRRAIIDAWREAFPRTPKVMLIGDLEGLRYATQRGCGWRADCLGDMGGFSKTWNHMEHFYRQQLQRAEAEQVWKEAPVAFESCWDMRKWVAEGWDVRFIFDYALDLHASYVNNKSAPLPEGTLPEVERLLRRLGYRLVLREVRHPRRVRRGEELRLVTLWENMGVAPPYWDFLVALRLSPLEAAGKPSQLITSVSIKGWLPGPREQGISVPLPKNLLPGRYLLALGIVHPQRKEPCVQLAIEGRDAEGWYPLSPVEVM